jgi:hypothetical protein
MLIKNSFRIKKIVLAVGVTVGVFGFAGGAFSDSSTDTYIVSMKDWKPLCYNKKPFVPKKIYFDNFVSKIAIPYSADIGSIMTLEIPKSQIQKMQVKYKNNSAYSIWNGINFQSGPLQIFQPVLWKGSNFSIPQNNQLPNYIWVYNDTTEFAKSDSWNNKNLDTYSELANLNTPIILHYFENNSWNEIKSDDIISFDEKVKELNKDDGGLFVNSQYVEFVGNYYKNGNNAQYDQISQDIIAVPSGASVTMQIEVTKDDQEKVSSITMTSTVNIPNVNEGPKSVLKVTQIHNPQDKSWKVSNVYNMINISDSDILNKINAIYPVVIEAVADSSSQDSCQKSISNLITTWNKAYINLGPRSLLNHYNPPPDIPIPNPITKKPDLTNRVF